ncbi:hypothetical protein [Flavobacterium sp.]|uniref:hypothetical protein n=1 Tax=Flavobacterium sp. TaxID=239 RepID=UPI0037510CE7
MKNSIQVFSILLLLSFCSIMAQSNLEKNTEVETLKLDATTVMFRYYFYPNLDTYYDRKTSEYIFKKEGNWVKELEIPSAYRGYSIYNNYRVEIADYKGETPYENLSENRKKFPYYTNDRKGKLAAMKAQQVVSN